MGSKSIYLTQIKNKYTHMKKIIVVALVLGLCSCSTSRYGSRPASRNVQKHSVKNAWQPFKGNDGCGAGRFSRPTAMWR